MADPNSVTLPRSEEWSVNQILQSKQQGSPILSSVLGAYLDVGDCVQLSRIVNFFSTHRSAIGSILEISDNNNSPETQTETAINHTAHVIPTDQNYLRWVRINWWLTEDFEFGTQDAPPTHVSLPTEIVRTNQVQWIPVSMITDIVHIFHLQDLLDGRYANTGGLRNVFYCRLIWNTTNQHYSSATAHPYFSLFDSSEVESYSERVWGVIEKVQALFLKAMGKTGVSQKLNYTETISMTVREWKIIKQRFNQDNFCFFSRKGNTTMYRYGKKLCQETIRNKNVTKEIITIENADMLQQLISAFGICVCSTVRKRFPPGAKVPSGRKNSQAVEQLKATNHVNSILVLSQVQTDNADIEYSYRKSTRGVDFRFDSTSRKFSLAVRYSMLDSTDDILKNFYSSIGSDPETDSSNQENQLVGKEFEAHDCLFVVSRIIENNNIMCRVLESDNDDYFWNDEYSFDLEFVTRKTNEYLENI